MNPKRVYNFIFCFSVKQYNYLSKNMKMTTIRSAIEISDMPAAPEIMRNIKFSENSPDLFVDHRIRKGK